MFQKVKTNNEGKEVYVDYGKVDRIWQKKTKLKCIWNMRNSYKAYGRIVVNASCSSCSVKLKGKETRRKLMTITIAGAI